MDSTVLMLAVWLRDRSSMHSKATIRRWVSVVQEHTGLRATQILVLGFPQRNQQKRHCCTDRHECRKPTNANKTPQMASRFYLRPCLLCNLTLWDRFTSSCFVVPQSPALESSLPPQILHRFGAPTDPLPSRRRHWRPYYPVALAITVFAAGSNKLLEPLQMAGRRSGPHNKWILESECTAFETIGKKNGTIATTPGSNGCATGSNVGKNGCNRCELLIKNGRRMAEQRIEQRLSPAVQR